MERRISVRVNTNVGVACRIPATPQAATVRDLSLHGCRVETAGPFSQAGGSVVLELGDWASVTGTIVWCDRTAAGIRFDRPLDLGRFGISDWVEAAGDGLAARLCADPSQAAA